MAVAQALAWADDIENKTLTERDIIARQILKEIARAWLPPDVAWTILHRPPR